MKYLVYNSDKTLKGSIVLPGSKSVANRALIIHALSYSPYPIENLSDSTCETANRQRAVAGRK
jgi:3-phosphoshikimate 1-carboxyvinyltransferase